MTKKWYEQLNSNRWNRAKQTTGSSGLLSNSTTTTHNESSKVPSQITLSVPLTSQYDNSTYRDEMTPTSCEYQTSGNANWKMAVSSVQNKTRITLYCSRKSSSDTLLAAGNNPYCRDSHKQGHATFSGPMLETTVTVDLNIDSNQMINIYGYRNTSLQMHITSLEPPAEDISAKIYEDAFSYVDKAQIFSEPSPFPSDCVIVFENNKEVLVNKALLSLHSEFWNEVFAKYKDKIPLFNVDYDEFLDLLCVIYPTRHPITTKNVETLSKLAHEFKMAELLKCCDIFLMANSAKFGRSKLLLLAQEYSLERLQAQCISKYNSLHDIITIKTEPEYASLHNRTKRMLLDKILGINSSELSETPMTKISDNETRAAEILDKLHTLSSCPSDIVLVVGNAQIPAHKQLLSYFSEFFNNMFQSEFKESRESEITLEEVRYEEMVELLSIIYPSDYTINETNIATIVKMADRFIMPIILERCKQELKNSNKIKGALKLWLAQQYKFTNLQTNFIRNSLPVFIHLPHIHCEPPQVAS
ncbi:BTB/POZ domain-containing protein [Ditylenchus destructor]|uniref:BTB/POZ domain-containing protein n=1 Tax=Ditylenchus destructor TaxID=166010 RepID=A0AAD4R0P6_9BILA|nr:BTB/POZ domain-containing protein [Ditylenchus destructor]